MKRVLIVNSCGLLAAMPTIEEYERLEFSTENCVVGLVEVSEQDAATIFENRTRVKVLLPGLPPPNEAGVYIAVLNGEVVIQGEFGGAKLLVESPAPRRSWLTKVLRAFK